MRLGGFRLVGKSITYLIMNKVIWLYIFMGVLVGCLFDFTNTYIGGHAYSTYFYFVVKVIFIAAWDVWLAVFVIQDLKHDRVNLTESLKQACAHLTRAWWYIVWIVLLQVLFTFSLNMPKSHGETLPILLVFGCLGIFGVQALGNFFLIPLIANGFTGFINAVGKTLVYLRRNFFTVLAAFCALFIMALIVFMAYGFCNILLLMALEKIFSPTLVRLVMRVLLIQFLIFTMSSLLVIAQSIFYVHLPHQPIKNF